MASLAHSKARKTPAPVVSSAPQAVQAVGSNAEQQEKLRAAQIAAAGQENYEAALSKAIGGALYKQIAKHLSLEGLSGYADKGFQAALKGLAKTIGKFAEKDGEVDPALITGFSDDLVAQYGELAGQWVSANGEPLINDMNGWISDNPTTMAIGVVTTALLAAGAAIAANLDVPKLQHHFKFGDKVTADLSANLNKFRDLALKEVKAKLAYESEKVKASIEVTRKEDGSVKGVASASAGDEEFKGTGKVEFTEKGVSVYAADVMKQVGKGKVTAGVSGTDLKDNKITVGYTRKDGSFSTTNSAKYDQSTGVITFVDSADQMLNDRTKVSVGSEYATDGGQKMTGGLAYNDKAKGLSGNLNGSQSKNGDSTVSASGSMQVNKHLNASANVSHAVTGGVGVTEVSGAFNYVDGATSAQFGGKVDSAGVVGQINGSLSTTFGESTTAEISASQTWGPRRQTKATGTLGHVSEKGDRSKLEGSFDSEGHRISISATSEYHINPSLKVLGNGYIDTSSTGTNYGASFQAQQLINSAYGNFGVIGGVGMTGGSGEKLAANVSAGVSYNDVAIIGTFDNRDKSASINLVFNY